MKDKYNIKALETGCKRLKTLTAQLDEIQLFLDNPKGIICQQMGQFEDEGLYITDDEMVTKLMDTYRPAIENDIIQELSSIATLVEATLRKVG